jgi:ANTAR domain-containing protein
VDEVLHALAASAEPTVAFASLAAACVPLFADQCHVAIADEADATLRIAYPPAPDPVAAGPLDATGTDPAGGQWAVAQVDAAACGGKPAYSATVAFRWHDTTTVGDVDVVIARLLTDRVAAQVQRERLAAEAARAADLETALASNREIGKALGILMATHKISSEEAFDLLRVVSQNSNRKLRDLAEEVNRTGVLEPPRQRRVQDSQTSRPFSGASA